VQYGDEDTTKALRFQGSILAEQEEGRLYVDHDGIHIIGATAATLFFSAATSFGGMDPDQKAGSWLNKLSGKKYDNIREEHIADHSHLFHRVSLSLGESQSPANLTTDQRISTFGE